MYKVMKIYYDRSTGEVLHTSSYNYIVEPDFDADYEVILSLKERAKESINLLVLKDGAYAQDFTEGRLIGVDLETKMPKFEYANPDNTTEPITPAKPLTVQIEEARAENLATMDALAEVYELILGGM